MTQGFVYVFTNEFMPGIVKIGYTTRTPEKRAWELYEKRTGVPGKFEVVYQIRCSNPKELEQKVHKRLSAHRVNAYREYFRVDISQAVDAISALSDPHLPVTEQSAGNMPKTESPPNTPKPRRIEAIPPKQAAPRPLVSIREDYERELDKADYDSRIAAATIVAVFIAPLTVFINDQIEAFGITERSIWTSILGAIVTYSLLRRFIGSRKRAKIEHEYRQKIER